MTYSKLLTCLRDLSKSLLFTLAIALAGCGGGGGGGGGASSGNASGASTATPLSLVPTISRDLENQSVVEGSDATFSVMAGGESPLSFTWYKNGIALNGGSSNVLVLPRITQSDTGSTIKVTISNTKGSVSSREATLTVTTVPTPPVISQNLSNQDVQVGQLVTLSVEATGTAPFTYQWFRNDQVIAGQTSKSYSFTAQASDNAARFQAKITNLAGTVDSAAAVINVSQAVAPISISVQPRDQIVVAGSVVSFSVTATSTSAIRYQWSKNGVPIPGATQGSYQFTSSLADNGAVYTVRLSNGVNEVTSQSARLSVSASQGVGVAPRVTSAPSSVTANSGQTVTFTVSAEGTAPLQYQWLKNGREIPNATQQSYQYLVGNNDVSADFGVKVTNLYGSANSSPARLTVNVAANGQAPQIVRQPSSVFVGLSESASLSVQASGSAPLTYEWFYFPDAFSDGSKNAIPNSNTQDLQLTARLLDISAGKYHKVRVSNAYGSVESEPILVDRADFNLNSIVPLQASPGDIVTINGVGLTKVLKLRLAGNEIAINSQGRTDTQIRFEIPANAVSSPVELSSANSILVSKSVLTIRPLFVVNTIAPDLSYENWNGKVTAKATLTGSGFSQVNSAYINWAGNLRQNLRITSQTDSQISFELPYVWRGFGDIVRTPIYLIRNGDAKVQATSLVWNIADRIIVEDNNIDTVAGLGAAISASGEEVAIRLVKNIPKNSKIQFLSNGVVVAEGDAISTSVGPVKFTIPENLQAGSYQLRFRGDRGQDDFSTSPMRTLTVVGRASVTNADSLTSIPAGGVLQIAGSNLNNISQATVGGIPATIVQKSANAVAISIPQSQCGGAIQLKSPYQTWFNAGANIFNIVGCSVARVSGVEVGQLFSHIVNNQTYQRLVPNKSSWVRAYVTAPSSGVAAPRVVAKVYNDAVFRGELTLSGPQTLPVLAIGQSLSTSMRQTHEQGFMGTIPSDWVRSGLKVTVVSNPDDSTSSKYSSLQATPFVGNTIISPKLMIVPIVDAVGRQPTIPPIEEIRNAINNYLPLLGSDVEIRVRANPLVFGACSGDSRLVSGCGNYATTMLYNIEGAQLPIIYHGIYPNPFGGGQAYQPGHSGASGDFNGGLGYRPNGNDYGVLQVMMHELSHNFNMGHVRGKKTANNSCGTPVEWSIDPNYPYASNGLYELANPVPPIFREPYTGRIVGPNSDLLNNDTQSYCSDRAFHSDYSTHVMRTYLEGDFTTESRLAQASADQVVPQSAKAAPIPSMLIAGVIFPNSSTYGIKSITPINVDSPNQRATPKSQYTLRIYTTDGRVISRAIRELKIPDSNSSEPEIHFFEKITDVGQIQSISILKDGKPIKLVEGNDFLMLGQSGVGALNDGPSMSISTVKPGATGLYRIKSSGRQFTINWDKEKYSLVTVSLVNATGRLNLVLNASGGAVTFDVPTETRSEDKLEIGFSTGLKTFSTSVQVDEVRRRR